mmetsp:Transcript_92635/g.258026  ORF Transcript_92635/g.258026 Transcript_92635/m.258026 type:complete len:219 (-) Transcript_92635:465-1121(-)
MLPSRRQILCLSSALKYLKTSSGWTGALAMIAALIRSLSAWPSTCHACGVPTPGPAATPSPVVSTSHPSDRKYSFCASRLAGARRARKPLPRAAAPGAAPRPHSARGPAEADWRWRDNGKQVPGGRTNSSATGGALSRNGPLGQALLYSSTNSRCFCGLNSISALASAIIFRRSARERPANCAATASSRPRALASAAASRLSSSAMGGSSVGGLLLRP